MSNDDQSSSEEEEVCLHFETFDDELPECFLKKAKGELNETPEVRGKCLDVLKEMLYAEDKDIKFASDNEFLVAFLRSRKFDPEKSYQLIHNYTKLKSKFDYFHVMSNMDPIKEIWKKNITGILPFRDPSGRAILVHRAAKWNPSEVSVDELYAGAVAMIIYGLQHPMTQINGFVAVLDLKGLSLTQLRLFTPGYARLLTYGLQDCLPGRYKAVHIINESALFKYGYALVKLFLRPKFKRRLHVHGNEMQSLHKYLPPSILPAEFDGHLESFDNSYILSQPDAKLDRVWTFINYSDDPESLET